jgi:endonuclease/exonuclease/phosphatase family metal-dependent hydrolase
MSDKTRFGFAPARTENLTEVLTRRAELQDVPSFRLAAYNVYNLFGGDPDVYSRRPNAPAPEEQLDALGEMILDLDADVIAFEEVQNEKVLSDLFRSRVNPTLKRKRQRPFESFVLVPARDPRGINVALATRLAVNGTMTFHDREFGPESERAMRFSRDLLGVELYATTTYRFLFFVAHLKSKIGGEVAEAKRGLEADEIRTILDEPVFGSQNAFIEQDMILAGDMNDDPGTRVIQILEGAAGKTRLRDVFAPVEPNFTFPTHDRYAKTRLDFVFTSPTIRVDSPVIHRDNPAAAAASDHYPISVTVTVTVP